MTDMIGSRDLIADRVPGLIEDVLQHSSMDSVEELERLLPHVSDISVKGEVERLLGFAWLRKNDFQKAISFSDMASEHLATGSPAQIDCVYNAMFALFRMNCLEEAIRRAQQALRSHGENFLWHDLLAISLGNLGSFEESRRHGTLSLQLKDALTADVPGRDLDDCPVAPFDPTVPERNIISFSLFGHNRKYVDGALLNAQAARFLYPGWTCRYYVDGTVAAPTIGQLRSFGAQVINVAEQFPAASHGTMWRFLVADDVNVDRFLIRDADSVVNLREAVAVQDWIDSNHHFHVMRDHFDHAELVLAGMWGGVRGALPPIELSIPGFLSSRPGVLNRTVDQEYLREFLWPTIRRSCLVHDSQFAFGSRRDFPQFAHLPRGSFVGCDGRKMLGLV